MMGKQSEVQAFAELATPKCQHVLVRFSEGNIESAIFNYNAAIDQDPKNSRAYRDRAEAHDKLSNKDKAEQDITKAKEIEAFI